ncbi:MAG: hypothetical protein JNL47_03765 [Bacteroidia bacterium]|nr:hypothetical protein [Bacteroidia bacterium]
MKSIWRILPVMPVLIIASITANAQQATPGLHGNFQTDAQLYKRDSAIGAPDVQEKLLANSFLNLTYASGNFSAGLRYESFLNALQGYDRRYEGNSFLFRYVTYNLEGLEITGGNFYEQFGYGLIFRSYQEWGLGFDNAMDGIRLRYQPVKGINLKAMIGRQRSFMDYGPGLVRGADGDINLNELLPSMSEKKTRLIAGGAFVSKYQTDDDPIYILPQNVSAYSVRWQLSREPVSFSGEYASKINDPNFDNGYIYKKGEALYVTIGYTAKNLGVSVSAKRIDNMSFRSDRTAILTNLAINYLPAITKQQTYRLATLYPYATQPNGEMGAQGELFYNFKKGTTLGGKYGTKISAGGSIVNSIDKKATGDDQGYTSGFFKPGKEKYFREASLEINKKLSPKLKFIFSEIYQVYNKDVVQGLSGYGIINANINVLETEYRINDKHGIRSELQHLYSNQDSRSWGMILLEYTVSPHWFVAVFDEYNYDNPKTDKRIHYYSASAGYVKNTLRFTLGYGKQREGLLCVGGVCRQVPASNGFTFSMTGSF